MVPIVKVALAGIAGYGESYVEALLPKQDSLGAKLVGVVDPAAQRSRWIRQINDAQIAVHSSLSELFAASTVDLMLIVTPIHLHCEHVLQSLRNGANVLCEKPLAGSLEDGRTMLQAAESSPAFVGIGYQWSFSQAVQSLKRDILAGVLGRPIQFKSLVFFPRSLQYFRRNDWAGRLRTDDGQGVYDSPANNAAAHYLHNMFYLLGPTRETSAMPATVEAELYRANPIENYDTAVIRSRTRSGVELLFYTTHAIAERKGPCSRFEFEHAVVEYDALGHGQFVARFHDGRVKNYGHPNFDRHEKIWQSIDSVRNGGSIACGVHAAMAHTLCVAAAQESVTTISDFPQRLKQTAPFDGDELVCVDRLAEELSDCYERGVMPAERRDIGWAVPGRRVMLDRGNEPTLRQKPVDVRIWSGALSAGAANSNVSPSQVL